MSNSNGAAVETSRKPPLAATPAPVLKSPHSWLRRSPDMPTSKASANSRDPRVDAYIANAAPFARAPLEHVREAMHAALPDVAEAIKWSHPFYLLDGKPF